jgi:drug/metabolite transporter (DMT)-like permease
MGAEPLFGALFASFWLDERLGLWGWLGGLLIVIASLWGTLPRRAPDHSDPVIRTRSAENRS